MERVFVNTFINSKGIGFPTYCYRSGKSRPDHMTWTHTTEVGMRSLDYVLNLHGCNFALKKAYIFLIGLK